MNQKAANGHVTETSTTIDDTLQDIQCGVCSWRPKCLQRFANHYVYAFAFIMIGIVQGMIMSYFSGVLTTIEKVFGMQSKTMGIVMSGNDISQILGGLLVNHYGSRGSRPVWVAIGMVTTGASCFMYAACHLLWNSSDYDDDLLIATQLQGPLQANKTTERFCSQTDSINSINKNMPDYDGSTVLDTRDPQTAAVLMLFFGGQLISGIGSIALFSLGFTYMDDSVKKTTAPLFTGITTSLRCLGPVLGFLLASFSLSFNVKPTEPSPYSNKAPLYIGAWWLGFLILGTLQMLITFPMLLFPKMLPSEKARMVNNSATQPELSSWTEFKESLIRVLKNPVAVAYLLSVGPIILAVIGPSIFLPKYIEAQFGQTARDASTYSGLSGMATMMIGTFLGGVIMWKFQPNALHVAEFSFVVDIIHIITTVFMMLIDCGETNFTGVELQAGKNYVVTSECSVNCNCPYEFKPLCIGTQNYLTPCLAGCTGMTSSGMFQNCTCTTPLLNSIWQTGRSGFCDVGGKQDCPYLLLYLVLNGTSKLLGSICRIGFIMIMIRCVEKRDKSMVMALMMVIGSLTGFIPSPIIYGAAVDNTCLIWGKKNNGDQGNCWIYDSQQFSYWFHGIKIACYAIVTILSVFICYHARNVRLYDEDDDNNTKPISDTALQHDHREHEQKVTKF